CPKDMREDDYNEMVAKHNPEYILMDQKFHSVEGGPKKIEACDLFSKKKQFIHVKNKGKSAQLSHLFAQGKISAQCFISDEAYRKQVADRVNNYFGHLIFDYKNKPAPDEYEVIYVIIDKNASAVVDTLPFFSLVNLMLAVQELSRMRVKCSVKIVAKKLE
ncbi:MAG: DUF6119 family protein, partial [Christensenellales bacterium]